MKISEIIEELQEAEKEGITEVKIGNGYIDKVTCDGIESTVDLHLVYTCGLSLSELIKELQSMRVGYGSDIEVTCNGFDIAVVLPLVNICDIKCGRLHPFQK